MVDGCVHGILYPPPFSKCLDPPLRNDCFTNKGREYFSTCEYVSTSFLIYNTVFLKYSDF